MRKTKILLSVAIMALSVASTAFAGEWKQETDGRWWYQNDDGGYPANQWQEIGGKQYYFGADGYMLANTTTPDGSHVGADGAKVETVSRSHITYSADSVTQALTVSDWIYGSYSSTYHIFEITNNSPHTITLNINETAKDHVGNVVGAETNSEQDIPSGHTIFVKNYFLDAPSVAEFETTFQTKIDVFYIPVAQNLAIETTRGNKKAIVKVTNNGAVTAEFPYVTAVFFKDGEISYVDSTYICDADAELKAGASLTEELNSYGAYDEVKVHLTAQRDKYSN